MSPENNFPCESPDAYGVRSLQMASLDAYRVFAELAAKLGIRYYAMGGTALGAVRHKGFIPWDDDIDIALPRPDYNRFLDEAEPLLPKDFILLKPGDQPISKFENQFMQFVDRRKEVLARVQADSPYHLEANDIKVDLIPLDGVPSSMWNYRMWRLRRAMARQARWLCVCPYSDFFRFPWRWLGVPLRLVHPTWKENDFFLLDEQILQENNYDTSKIVGTAVWFTYRLGGCRIPRKFWGTPKMMPFEDIQIPVPEDVDGYLKILFGDYMTLPPIEQRHPLHVK